MRMVKDETEIAAIRKAIELTDAGLRRVLETLAPGQMEYEAQAEFEYAIKKGCAEGTAFDTIAGSGLNGCMLHYETNHCRIEENTLLLLDLGAKKDGYCADITRTYPVSGVYTERQKQIYDIVLAANLEVSRQARPGLTLRQLNEICKQKLSEGMMAIGKIESAEQIGTYYMHGVSHHLGLDTHDAHAHDETPLAPGMVITNEPGLYIDEERIGIRIEDDLLITEDGCEVLSSQIPRETKDIEALMARRNG
jgi:Xaa-Pro aminopeptidase